MRNLAQCWVAKFRQLAKFRTTPAGTVSSSLGTLLWLAVPQAADSNVLPVRSAANAS
jgi:hypothetical protein